MVKIYGTDTIPGDTQSVDSGSTVDAGGAVVRTAGIVGGMDTASGSATPGEVVRVGTTSEASNLFGQTSELYKAIQLVFDNALGVELYAVGVVETSSTENFSATASGTLTDVPFDPNVHPDHSITESGGATVNIVYDDPVPAPTDANTINLNPNTKEFTADASGTYDIVYDHGDYASAITAMGDESPAVFMVLSEDPVQLDNLVAEMTAEEVDFDFMHGFIGAPVGTSTTDMTDYTTTEDEWRLSVVAPSRGYTDSAGTNMVRTVAALGGYIAGRDLGDSSTYDELEGLASVYTTVTPSQSATLIDKGVVPLMKFQRVTVVKDMTTASDARFSRVYAVQIVDEVSRISHVVSRSFTGEANTSENRSLLYEGHHTPYTQLKNNGLLDAFNVTVTQDAGGNDNEVDVEIGIDVVDVMDTIDVSIVVGDVVQNGGVN